MQTLTCENFKENACQGTVVVDFSATWCGPCKVLKPVLEEIARDSTGKIFIVDVDESPELAEQYSVNAMPTVLVFKDGVETKRLIGLTSKQAILDAMK